MNKTAPCGFCGVHGTTKEHVWPEWLRTLILRSRTDGLGKKFIMQVVRGGRPNRFPSTKLEMTVHMPCGQCNNGWMSNLEGIVRPFMAEMVFPGEVTLLSAERQALLAKWAVKTAMVFEYVNASVEKYYTGSERAAFRSLQTIPRNTRVWLGHYDGVEPIHALQHHIGQRRGGMLVTPAYSLTLTAGFVLLQVFSYRKPGTGTERLRVRPGPWRDALIPIWPTAGVGLMWPPTVRVEDQFLQLLDHRFITGAEEGRG